MREMIKMGEQRSFKDVLRENRRILLAILLLPVIGMVVAIPLIFIRAPQNFAIAGILIIAMLLQYLIVVFFIMHRIDRLTSS